MPSRRLDREIAVFLRFLIRMQAVVKRKAQRECENGRMRLALFARKCRALSLANTDFKKKSTTVLQSEVGKTGNKADALKVRQTERRLNLSASDQRT